MILNRILRHPSVSLETIAGAIDVYVILFLIFSSLYRAIASASGGPFFVLVHHASVNQYLYFSFATQTTVGYGDLTVATNLGRSLVVMEALLGQIFLVTLVARLSVFAAREKAVMRIGYGGRRRLRRPAKLGVGGLGGIHRVWTGNHNWPGPWDFWPY